MVRHILDNPLKSGRRIYFRKFKTEGTGTTFLFVTEIVDSFLERLSLCPVHPPTAVQ